MVEQLQSLVFTNLTSATVIWRLQLTSSWKGLRGPDHDLFSEPAGI